MHKKTRNLGTGLGHTGSLQPRLSAKHKHMQLAIGVCRVWMSMFVQIEQEKYKEMREYRAKRESHISPSTLVVNFCLRNWANERKFIRFSSRIGMEE